MTFFQAVVLGIVQGLTEFLPVSSSGHLILFPAFLGWTDQGVAFDAFVHIGTLFAVVWHFRHMLFSLARGAIQKPFLAWNSDRRMILYLFLATVPALFVGFVIDEVLGLEMRSTMLVAFNLFVFALVLWYADKQSKTGGAVAPSGLKAFGIGCAQALALLPGVSRSGITLSAGLFFGLDRKAAITFSFLLSIPIIFLSGGLKILQIVRHDMPVVWSVYMAGAFAAMVSGALAIRFFLRIVERYGLLPFVWYRIALAVFILLFL